MDKKYLFSIRACASSADLGPGFDRAAIALNIFNRYRVAGFRAGFEVRDLKSGQPAAVEGSLMVKAVKHTLKSMRP
ncbi:MAG: hypothetical protein U5N58_03170 [Actinomycetota bacterium]|nr:hypothetical protein [Actinomycetota bacterium]